MNDSDDDDAELVCIDANAPFASEAALMQWRRRWLTQLTPAPLLRTDARARQQFDESTPRDMSALWRINGPHIGHDLGRRVQRWRARRVPGDTAQQFLYGRHPVSVGLSNDSVEFATTIGLRRAPAPTIDARVVVDIQGRQRVPARRGRPCLFIRCLLCIGTNFVQFVRLDRRLAARDAAEMLESKVVLNGFLHHTVNAAFRSLHFPLRISMGEQTLSVSELMPHTEYADVWYELPLCAETDCEATDFCETVYHPAAFYCV